MIEEGKRERLDAFGRALEEEGYTVVETEPKLAETITETVDHEDDDTVGFVVVETPVEIRGHEFEGDLVVTVHENRLSSHGVDVRSDPEDPIPEEQRALLSEAVPPREVTDDDGDTRQVWSYYAPPADLPDGIVDDSRDNLDEVIAELEAIYVETQRR